VKRIPSLDGLRAISISLVIVGHFFQEHGWIGVCSGYANTGVRIFFVISGYLITTLLLREHEKSSTIHLREFYVRRAYRILPAALVFTIPVLIFYSHELHWYQAAAALLYLVNFDFSRPWFIGHLWSLGVEEQFYLLWPSVLKRWFRYRVAILLCVVAVAPIYSTACYAFKIHKGAYGTFPAVADTLAMGCLLALFASRLPKIGRIPAFCMLLGTALIPQFPADRPIRTLFMLFVLWPVLHVCIAGVVLHVVQNPYRILNLAPVVFVGRISYSLYLWQQLFFDNPQQPPLWIAIPCSVGFACLSYYLVEQPILRLRDRKRESMQTAFACAATAGD
jgi:peptidoglycan/LPS O-acetylase OafA/YrhL